MLLKYQVDILQGIATRYSQWSLVLVGSLPRDVSIQKTGRCMTLNSLILKI